MFHSHSANLWLGLGVRGTRSPFTESQNHRMVGLKGPLWVI